MGGTDSADSLSLCGVAGGCSTDCLDYSGLAVMLARQGRLAIARAARHNRHKTRHIAQKVAMSTEFGVLFADSFDAHKLDSCDPREHIRIRPIGRSTMLLPRS